MEKLMVELANTLKNVNVFVLDQAPDVIKQLIQMEIFSCLFALVIGILLLIIAIGLLAVFLYNDDLIVLPVISGFSIVISLIIISCNIHGYYKVTQTPKVFLLEKFSELSRTTVCK